MARLYAVVEQSETLPLTFKVSSVPEPENTATRSLEQRLQGLGLEVVPFSIQSTEDVEIRLANLVFFTVRSGRKRNARELELFYKSRMMQLREFVASTAQAQIVPVESSPLHGLSIDSLMKQATLTGFASFSESYGLVHHDPVICILTPVATVIIGAAVGAGEGLQENVKRFFGAKPKRRRKGDSRKDQRNDSGEST